MPQTRKFGLYLPGGVEDAIAAIKGGLKITACQVYLSGPMRYLPASRYMEDKVAEAIVAFQQETGVEIVVHAPYVISIVTGPEKSAECIKRHLAICDKCAINNLVVHSGSWAGELDPVETWVKFLNEQVKIQDFATTICLENMAYGNGRAMSGEQLNKVCEQVRWPLGDTTMPAVGVCLDTVHAWVGSADLSKLDKKNIQVIHLNQTKDGLGSGHDRHSENHLNEGVIQAVSLGAMLLLAPDATIISEFDNPDRKEQEKEIDLVQNLLDQVKATGITPAEAAAINASGA